MPRFDFISCRLGLAETVLNKGEDAGSKCVLVFDSHVLSEDSCSCVSVRDIAPRSLGCSNKIRSTEAYAGVDLMYYLI